MDVDTFIRRCFYRRLLDKVGEEGTYKLGGIESTARFYRRNEILPDKYMDTDLWDDKLRHPLLCLGGHYTWKKTDDKTPSSFTFKLNPAISPAALKRKVEQGDWIAGAFFQHWKNEKPQCNCSYGRALGDDFIGLQRKETLSN